MVLSGRAEAFEPLVTPYRGPLVALAYRLTRNREEALEVAQEALLRAFRSLGRFDVSRSFRNWLFQIAANEARDRLSDSEYRVGLFYHRVRWYPGSIERLRGVIDSDPEFTNRDAVYFYLGENLIIGKMSSNNRRCRADRRAKTAALTQRLVNFGDSLLFIKERCPIGTDTHAILARTSRGRIDHRRGCLQFHFVFYNNRQRLCRRPVGLRHGVGNIFGALADTGDENTFRHGGQRRQFRKTIHEESVFICA